MLIGGIALGLVLGLLAGGTIAQPRLDPAAPARAARARGRPPLRDRVRCSARASPIVDTLRLPLFATAFGLLLVALWANRGYPGMSLAFVGILSNTIAILVNGGYMPIWEPSLERPA